MAKVLYFARLAEALGVKSEQLDLSADCKTIADLIELLCERGEPFASEFNGDTRILVAINQQMSAETAEISNADEIAFFPPVTGG